MQINSVKPPGPEGENCPHMGGRPCSECCQTCTMWLPVREHNLDGKTLAEGFECAHKLTAFGVLKTAREVRQNCATTDKVKNNVARFHDYVAKENMSFGSFLKPVLAALGVKMLDGPNGHAALLDEQEQTKAIEHQEDDDDEPMQ